MILQFFAALRVSPSFEVDEHQNLTYRPLVASINHSARWGGGSRLALVQG